MKIPRWLLAIIILIIFLGFTGFFVEFFSEYRFLSSISSLALILTLAVVSIYAYYTYLLAKDAWTPSASFMLKQFEDDPYHFHFIIKNNSKVSLSCWCDLNIKVFNKEVSLGGFYGGQSSFDLQPYGIGLGHFNIRDILTKENFKLEDMKRIIKDSDVKEALYFDIEFWYYPIDNKELLVRNPNQPHYFDFSKDIIVTDF
jgi:hypothetical protein